MELIVLPAVVELGKEPGSFVIAHDESGVSAPIAAGEDVVLLDVDRELHAGTVTALSVRDGRLHYTVRQGVRLPPGVARLRLEGDGPLPSDRFSDDDLLDLLGELRDDQDR
ncbi:MAG: hypothetical protein JWN84_2130 [Nocardioides sp.]|nr:hypothetical protein [Nocardioides sp.]